MRKIVQMAFGQSRLMVMNDYTVFCGYFIVCLCSVQKDILKYRPINRLQVDCQPLALFTRDLHGNFPAVSRGKSRG